MPRSKIQPATVRETYREIWRQALTKPEGVRIKLKDPATARRFRFALYDSVKAIREKRERADEVLMEAVEAVMLRIDPADPTIVMTALRTEDPAFLAAQAMIGPVRTTEQRMADEMLARTLDKVASAPPEPAAAPKLRPVASPPAPSVPPAPEQVSRYLGRAPQAEPQADPPPGAEPPEDHFAAIAARMRELGLGD